MSGLINELVTLLEEQAKHYENLLALSIEKKDVIISNNIEDLQKITGLENTIIGKNQRLDKKRTEIVKDIANVLNKTDGELTLFSLMNAIEDQPEHLELSTITQRIRTALDELSTVNEHNKVLISNSLDYIDFTMNVIRTSVSQETPGYSSKLDEMPGGKAFFDAKQ